MLFCSGSQGDFLFWFTGCFSVLVHRVLFDSSMVPSGFAMANAARTSIIHRSCEPSFVIRLWKTVLEIKFKQNKLSTTARLIRLMAEKYKIGTNEMLEQMLLAYEDRLIEIIRRDGSKRIDTIEHLKKSSETDVVLIPTSPPKVPRDMDMYCFTCHTAGEVVPCKQCWRVMHPTTQCWVGATKTRTCKECIESKDHGSETIRGKIPTVDQMREILREVMKQIQSKCPEIKSLFTSRTYGMDQTLWSQVLFKPSVTLPMIQEKIEARRYRTFLQFYQDFNTLKHNVMLIFGRDSLLGHEMKSALTIVIKQNNAIHKCSTLR